MALQMGHRGVEPGDDGLHLPWLHGPNGPILALSDRARHLVAWPYSTANLHAMAERLGIGRHFYHARPHPHYDIPARRVDEIESKTLRVSSKDIVRTIYGYMPKFKRTKI